MTQHEPISPAERWALWHLAARGPITAAALAARLGVDAAGLSVLFEALGRRGYVRQDPQGVPDLTSNGRRTLVARVKAGRTPGTSRARGPLQANSPIGPASLVTSVASAGRAVGATFLSTAAHAESGHMDRERELARWENEGGAVQAGAPTDGSRRTIVVGVDRSRGARIALEQAARRAGPDGRLLVATVVTPGPDAFGRAVTELRDDRREAARQLVDRLVAEVAVDAETRVLEGDPAERLAQLARESDADEIVVGSRGTGRLAAVLGSVSHALVAHADHPVVVVPDAVADDASDDRPRSVVVGYDGSPPADAALTYAATRAAGGGRVVAVHAYEPVPGWLGKPAHQQALDKNQARGRERLRALEARGGVATSLLEGPPARAIVAAADARDADEIVIGSRGFGPLRGLAGSVSHAVLHEADRPVVVIPADAVAAAA